MVLDNFEHLRSAAGLVAELLTSAPGLRLLVTSREALNLQQEWFHPVNGLSFPAEDEEKLSMARLAHYDAIRLFEHHARRVSSNFQLSQERSAVVQLCRLVTGIPLALELAASWLKVLPVDQIVAALSHNLDILTARAQDMPPRHRSMRVVLEESWRLLASSEQQVLAGLSVFCGDFDIAAAAAVCGANLAQLATLVDQSLLRRSDADRFQLHELLRQFAGERLAEDHIRKQQVQQQHCGYYLDLLAAQEQRLNGQDQQGAIGVIARAADNVRAAWQWACEQQQFDRLEAALLAYYSYMLTRSTFQEGSDRFNQAVMASTPIAQEHNEKTRERVYARTSIRAGAFTHYLGDAVAAQQYIDQGLEYAHKHDLQRDIGLARLIQGAAAGISGDAERGRRWLNEALSIGRAQDDKPFIANVLHELALISGHYGDFVEGKRLAQESVTFSRASGQVARTAYALIQQAWLSACRGEYEEAEACWHEALVLFESVASRYGKALALGGTGYVAWCIGDDRLPEAHSRTERSLELLRTLNHRVSITSRLNDLARIELDLGDYRQAETHAQEGLAIAQQDRRATGRDAAGTRGHIAYGHQRTSGQHPPVPAACAGIEPQTTKQSDCKQVR